MPGPIVCYVSGHGFGHATRSVALLAALRSRAPELELHVRSEAPLWFFGERDPRVACTAAAIDPGIVQTNSFDVDAEATLAAHRHFVSGWNESVEREARFLRELGAALVVADVPPLACAAARRAEVPAALVGNFTWAWIFGCWVGDDPRWAPIVERYRSAYADADVAHRLPLHSDDDFDVFRRIEDAPLLVNRSQRPRAECRAALGLAPDDDRRVVLVSFGGFNSGGFRVDPGEDLSGYFFVGLDGAAPPGLDGLWLEDPRPLPLPHEDLVHACDAIIGKAGFSTVAEALAHATRFLCLPRANLPEVPVLEAGLYRHGCGRPMPRTEFETGRWRTHLDALFAAPEPLPHPACDGAERIAEALLERIGH